MYKTHVLRKSHFKSWRFFYLSHNSWWSHSKMKDAKQCQSVNLGEAPTSGGQCICQQSVGQSATLLARTTWNLVRTNWNPASQELMMFPDLTL